MSFTKTAIATAGMSLALLSGALAQGAGEPNHPPPKLGMPARSNILAALTI